GYTPEEAHRAGLAGVLTPASYERALHEMAGRLATDEERRGLPYAPQSVEYDFVHKDGHLVPCEVTTLFIRDERGHPTGVVAMSHNITHRKKLTDRMRMQRDLAVALSRVSDLDEALRLWIDAALDVSGMDCATVHLFDEQGHLRIAAHKGLSAAFVESVAYLDKEMADTKLVQAGVPQYGNRRDSVAADSEMGRRAGVRAIGMVPLLNEGRSIGCLMVGSRAVDEVPEGARVALETITAQTGGAVTRIETESELRKSAETHGQLVETMNEGLAIIDENGRIAFANKRLCVALGYGRPELLGREAAELLSEDQAVLLTRQKALWEEGDAEPFEMEWTCRDKRTLPVLASPSPIMDERGHFHGGLVVFTDLTQVKQLQKRISRAEKMESLGRLAGGVAHDLNNILSGIVSYPDLLLLDVDEDSRMYRPLRAIKESGLRAAGIVEDLLTLTRRAIELDEIVNLNGLVESYLGSVEFARLQAHHKLVTVVRDMEPDLLNVRGSSLHLSKVLMNLLSNAMEAIPEEGRVTVSTRNEYVEEAIEGYDTVNEGEYVVLRVTDTGTGMSIEDRKHIFEPFYTKKVMGRSGTGLGLTVVWGTLNDHRGYVDVQSEEGKGTLFALYIPATREAMTRHAGDPSLDEIRGNGEMILVVDDAVEQREIVSRMLHALGYEVHTAANGEKGVEFVRHHRLKKGRPVDLVVLDMIMGPGMDGLDTYREMLRVSPKQRAIISSGYSETGRVREAQRLGASAYIKKPYGLKAMGLVVKQALEN
ncbi:MAG: PAS domain S-box protein, partial [Nitrospiraceae bacterium]|nr:PAS domain S-box protein [Nitrospiraceae bacterium]